MFPLIVRLLFTQYYYPRNFKIRGYPLNGVNQDSWVDVYSKTNNTALELVIELPQTYTFTTWELRVNDITTGSHIEVRRFDIGIKNNS